MNAICRAIQSLAIYSDMHRYIPLVIDVISNYLHLVPLKTNSGPSVASVFRSILQNDSRRPLRGHTEKDKEFLNKQYKEMLRDE